MIKGGFSKIPAAVFSLLQAGAGGYSLTAFWKHSVNPYLEIEKVQGPLVVVSPATRTGIEATRRGMEYSWAASVSVLERVNANNEAAEAVREAELFYFADELVEQCDGKVLTIDAAEFPLLMNDEPVIPVDSEVYAQGIFFTSFLVGVNDY